MKGQIVVSKEAARLFLLKKQMLLPPQNLKGCDGITKVFEALRSVQFDPLNICARNPDLVLQSRISEIHPDDYHKWLYDERRGIEFRDKELCIVDIDDLHLCSSWYGENDGTRTGSFLAEHKKELDKLLKKIKKDGPISSLDLTDDRKIDIWWGPTKWSKGALDSLWRSGKIVISFRRNGKKYYDIPEKVYGKKLKFPTATQRGKKFKEIILRRIESVGMLPSDGTGTGWLGIGKSGEIREDIRKLLRQKILTEVEITEIKRRYVIFTKDEPIFDNLKISKKKAIFLAPLDNLLWDRRMIKDLFDFDYTWEVYMPESKRKYGYYVLPILYGDRFIGRIEPVFNKTRKILEIKNIWFEPEMMPDDILKADLVEAIEKFKDFVGAKDVKYAIKR